MTLRERTPGWFAASLFALSLALLLIDCALGFTLHFALSPVLPALAALAGISRYSRTGRRPWVTVALLLLVFLL